MKCFIICFLLFAFAGLEVESKCDCRVSYRELGCFNDQRHNRGLPEILITERDPSMKAYNGRSIDWSNWNEYLPEFTCRCAEAAMKKGYKVFGMQFWGECWSGPSPVAEKTYDKHGKSGFCFGPDFKRCDPENDNCMGSLYHNFVYEIVTYHNCPVSIERLGCYSDRRNPRPLDEYILTDRQKSSSVYSNHEIEWSNFKTYLPDLSCRCAEVAKQKGYDTFSIQYYGECWSGLNASSTYFKDGESTECKNQCYEKCRSFDSFCVGLGHTNFVYRITKDVCEIDHKVLGCFKRNTDRRALDKLIMNDIDRKSSKFSGMVSTEFKNWAKYMEGLVCRCARKIKEKGYTTFAIINGGECWSGANAHQTYGRYGASNKCYDDRTTPCTTETCAGGRTTAYVYQLK